MKNNLEIEGLDYKSIDPSLKKIRRMIMSIFILILLVANTSAMLGVYASQGLTTPVITMFSIFYLLIIILFIWAWWLIGRQIDNYKYAKAEKDLVISKGVLSRAYPIRVQDK